MDGRRKDPHEVNSDLLSVAQELAEVTRLVADDDLETTLDRYVRWVERTVPGCDHASITVGVAGGAETVAGRHEPLLGYRPDERPTDPSPVLDALIHREPRWLSDIDRDRRWPAYTSAMRDAGYRSAIALPLAAANEPSAVFTLYSRKAGQFTETSHDLVLLFVLNAGVVFDNASLYHDSRTLVSNLREALVTRATIGQAQGLLMRALGGDAESAFAVLKGASQHHNIKLRELARSLVEAHEVQQLDDVLRTLALHRRPPAPT